MDNKEKLKKIYETIASKELGFGCLCIVDSMNPIKYRMSSWDERPKEEIIKIIGHPVMIGDVLDWIEKQPEEKEWLCVWWVLSRWEDKRKPIDDQTDECIDFIYSLINDGE